MKQLLLLTALLSLCFTVCANASTVQAVWSPTDVQRLLADSDQQGEVTPDRQGLGFPLLLIFDGDGRLAWQGDPNEFPDLSLPTAEVAKPGYELAQVLSQIDSITREVVPEGTAPPSASVLVGRPTAILVVLSAKKGLCPPCDSSLSILEQLPGGWNRITAALTI